MKTTKFPFTNKQQSFHNLIKNGYFSYCNRLKLSTSQRNNKLTPYASITTTNHSSITNLHKYYTHNHNNNHNQNHIYKQKLNFASISEKPARPRSLKALGATDEINDTRATIRASTTTLPLEIGASNTTTISTPTNTSSISKTRIISGELRIRLLQYRRDPRSQQIRALLDYFNIPYYCYEIMPFYKKEFEALGYKKSDSEDGEFHAPLLAIYDKKLVDEEINVFKQRAVRLIPSNARKNVLQVAHPITFKDRVEYVINKNDSKNKDELIKQLNDMFEFHDKKINTKYSHQFHHKDIINGFIPWIKEHLSNDQRRRFFEGDNIDDDALEYFSNEFVNLLRANQVRSISYAFHLFDYLRIFKKSRQWGWATVEACHIRGGFFGRFKLKKRLKKLGIDYRHASPTNPNSKASKHSLKAALQISLTYWFSLMTRERTETGEIQRTSFHGGRRPDILDILVYGAIHGCKELDIMTEIQKVPNFTQWYQQVKDEIGDTSCLSEE